MLRTKEHDAKARRKLDSYLLMAAAIKAKTIEIAIGLQEPEPTAFELAEGQGRR